MNLAERASGPLIVALLTVLGGCVSSTSNRAGTPDQAVSYTVITDSVDADQAMLDLTAPYAAQLSAQMDEVVGWADSEIQKGRPEGPLGTFAAEALLSEVQKLVDRPVDMALTNNGGLRTTIGPGAITVGRMFELMPFENMMIVLDLTAAQVDTLAQQLARGGGDPIAGFSFTIDAVDQAVGIRVSGQELEPGRTYRLVTSDYLANGGGPYDILWGIDAREELSVLLRDAFIAHLRAIGRVEAETRGLITRER